MFDYFNGFWKWVSDNPDKVDPSFCAVYFALLNRANKTGWKDSFAIILIDLQEDCGICSRTTMLKVLSKLEEYGFVETISKTNNQYKNRVIRLPLNGKHVESTWIPLEKHVETTWTHNKTIKDNKDYKEYEEIRVEESTLIVPKKKQTKREFLDYKSKRFFKNDEANNLILEFFDHLVEIKRPPTLRSARMIIKRLNKAKCVEQIIESIEKAIAGQYFTIYLEVQRDSYSSNLSFEKNKNGAAASPNTFSRASNGLQIK
jgi:hypothetical protein